MTVMRQSSADTNFASSRAERKARSASADSSKATAIFLYTATPVRRRRDAVRLCGDRAPAIRILDGDELRFEARFLRRRRRLAGGVVEPLEDGGLEGDAMVAEAVVGVEVDGGNGRAGLLDCGDERFVGGAKSVVGRDVEHGTRRDLGGERGEAPGGDVGFGFVQKCRGGGAG